MVSSPNFWVKICEPYLQFLVKRAGIWYTVSKIWFLTFIRVPCTRYDSFLPRVLQFWHVIGCYPEHPAPFLYRLIRRDDLKLNPSLVRQKHNPTMVKREIGHRGREDHSGATRDAHRIAISSSSSQLLSFFHRCHCDSSSRAQSVDTSYDSSQLQLKKCLNRGVLSF